MKFRTIPAEIVAAIVALLAGYVPDLTPTQIVAALRSFEPDKPEGTKRPPPPPMYSLQGAAEALALSVDTLRRMVKDGRIAGHKVGKLWRIPAAAVTALAEVGEAVK